MRSRRSHENSAGHIRTPRLVTTHKNTKASLTVVARVRRGKQKFSSQHCNIFVWKWCLRLCLPWSLFGFSAKNSVYISNLSPYPHPQYHLNFIFLITFGKQQKLRVSTADRLLGLRLRIPPVAWMVIRCECCVCCQVEVSATSWSLVQRSPTDCDVSLCVISEPLEWGGSNS